MDLLLARAGKIYSVDILVLGGHRGQPGDFQTMARKRKRQARATYEKLWTVRARGKHASSLKPVLRGHKSAQPAVMERRGTENSTTADTRRLKATVVAQR